MLTSLHTDVPGFRAATPNQLPLVTWSQVGEGIRPRVWTGSLKKPSWARAVSCGEPGGRGAGKGAPTGLEEARRSRSIGGRGCTFLLKESPHPSLQLPPAAEHAGTARRRRPGCQRCMDEFRAKGIRAKEKEAVIGAEKVSAGTGLGVVSSHPAARSGLESRARTALLAPLLQHPLC